MRKMNLRNVEMSGMAGKELQDWEWWDMRTQDVSRASQTHLKPSGRLFGKIVLKAVPPHLICIYVSPTVLQRKFLLELYFMKNLAFLDICYFSGITWLLGKSRPVSFHSVSCLRNIGLFSCNDKIIYFLSCHNSKHVTFWSLGNRSWIWCLVNGGPRFCET